MASLDALVVLASLLLAWSARAATTDLDVWPALPFGAIAIGVAWAINYAFGLYHRLWKYAAAGEIVTIGAAVAVGTLLLLAADLFWPGTRPVPLSVVLMEGLFAFVGFVSVRYRGRVWSGLRWRWRALRGGFPQARTRVLIVGAGEAGQLLAWRFLNHKGGEHYQVVGFVDDDPGKQGMRVHGIPVLGDRHAIPDLVARHQVALVILAIYNISGEDFRAILEICQETPAAIKVLPSVFDFLSGKNGVGPLRDVQAEDLLGRQPVEVDLAACRSLLEGKRVLVTGAAGSIGSELCRQIVAFAPERLVMVDNNESGLYDLDSELQMADGRRLMEDGESGNPQSAIRNPKWIPVVADVTHRGKMKAVFAEHRPQVVFHAAAYKHVPLMEAHPDEAVRVNVLGTWVVADLARQYGSGRFVLISTDKAVNPSCVMGATKRLCEMLVTTADHGPLAAAASGQRSAVSGQRTLFTAVRFGNVLGSRGSVVPTFERQIQQGGPVTVTHREMTRYFMTVQEAVSLIIQAATFTEGGDLFLLDMGRPVRIDDLARKLIRLRGLRPEVDIPIVYTGVRPGEKLHEELWSAGEDLLPTPHSRIYRVRQEHPPAAPNLEAQVRDLVALAQAQRQEEVVARLWEVVGNAYQGAPSHGASFPPALGESPSPRPGEARA
ncbi:MAG: polysaccharide biosynthesis protein [Anaerolineae bacterium]